jgi:hypothetical protein
MIRTIYIDYDPDENDTVWIVGPSSEIVVNLPHSQITTYTRDKDEDDDSIEHQEG